MSPSIDGKPTSSKINSTVVGKVLILLLIALCCASKRSLMFIYEMDVNNNILKFRRQINVVRGDLTFM